MLSTIEQKAARELAEMAVEAHNSRPGCPDPDCSVCARDRQTAQQLIEACKLLGVEVIGNERYLHIPEKTNERASSTP